MILTVILSVFGVDMTGVQASNVRPDQVEVIKQTSKGGGEFIGELLKLPLGLIFVLFIFYFLGGYFLYSSLFAAIGAAVDNETDTQQFMLPVMLPLILGMYVGFTWPSKPNGPISTFFFYCVKTSIVMLRVPFGVPWYEIVILCLATYNIM